MDTIFRSPHINQFSSGLPPAGVSALWGSWPRAWGVYQGLGRPETPFFPFGLPSIVRMLKIRLSFSAAFYLGSCLARVKVWWLPQGQAQQRWASSPDSLYSGFSASRPLVIFPGLDASLSLSSPQRSQPLLASLPLSRASASVPAFHFWIRRTAKRMLSSLVSFLPLVLAFQVPPAWCSLQVFRSRGGISAIICSPRRAAPLLQSTLLWPQATRLTGGILDGGSKKYSR